MNPLPLILLAVLIAAALTVWGAVTLLGPDAAVWLAPVALVAALAFQAWAARR
ncbi:MAG: hypothetical protein ACU0BF_00225 [Paracoccaceae bacterium]